MATRHELALDVIETSCENILNIRDQSVYALGLNVDCPRLDVWVPGFAQPNYFDTPTTGLLPNFDLRLSPTQLCVPGLPVSATSTLPDGIYTIRYSVSPNNLAFVEYYHLRTTKLTNAYYKELCKLRLEPCEPTAEIKQKLNDLRYIKMLIDGAKAKTEYCHSPKQGKEMYDFAAKQLHKYQNGCCLTCH